GHSRTAATGRSARRRPGWNATVSWPPLAPRFQAGRPQGGGFDAGTLDCHNAGSFNPKPFRRTTLANIKSAKKRAKQAVKRRERNMGAKSMVRTALKKVVKAIEAKDAAAAQDAFKTAEPLLDRYSSRGLIHRNKAARHKTRLQAKIKALAA